jgi:hypothetical protein
MRANAPLYSLNASFLGAGPQSRIAPPTSAIKQVTSQIAPVKVWPLRPGRLVLRCDNEH